MKKKPICKQCEKQGQKYSVTDSTYGVTTCAGITPGYWDEEGKYHKPVDPNTTTYEYSCSNGHRWTETK